MATLSTYGNPKTVIRQNEWLWGRFATAWGVNLNAPVVAGSVDIEYGKILKITQSGLNSNAYVGALPTDTASLSYGVVLRTTDGQISMEGGFLERPRTNTPVSIYPLATANNFVVAVPLMAGQTPTIGNAVYVSHNAGSEGAVRTDDTNARAITGWTFASTAYTPTTSDSLAVLIQKTV